MFPLAIELAQNEGMGAQEHSLIHRRFGDHLYQKGDYDGAMSQYIRAIDATEPSQVIRKVSTSLETRYIVLMAIVPRYPTHTQPHSVFGTAS